jgi:hypothetical protein
MVEMTDSLSTTFYEAINCATLNKKRVTARGGVISIAKLIGTVPSFSPFDKGD